MVKKTLLSSLSKIKLILLPSEIKTGYLFIFYMLISMLFETLGVGLIAPLIKVVSDPNVLSSDNYLSGVINLLEINSFKSLVIFFSFGIVLIYLIKNVFLSYFTWFKIRYLSTLRMNLSNRLLNIYLSQPYTFHLDNNSGQLIQNTVSEVSIFTGRLLGPSVVILTEGLVFLGIVLLLFFVEPIGALTLIILMAFVAKLILSSTRKKIIRWGEERQYHDGKKIQHLQQGLNGVKDVLILGKVEFFLNQFKTHNMLSRIPDQKQGFFQEVPRFLFEVLAVIGLISIILIMSFREQEISDILATLGVFGAAAFRLMPSVTRLLASIQSIRYSYPVLDKLQDEFQSNESFNEDIESKKLIGSFNENGSNLSISNVNFSYKNSKKMSLKNISLKILKGDCIGIIGSSGAGKSTLVDIILGLLKPDSGVIEVNNINIHSNLRSWQSQIGYVPQFIYLTDDSLKNNIAFGVAENEIDYELVEESLKAAQLSEFVSHLEQGIETHIGERGVRLSGGQRQRIGIARALYNRPNVIVFDEATSSLDFDTEKLIMKTIYKLNKLKTIIIISHRVSTLENCDRVYNIENGKINDVNLSDY